MSHETKAGLLTEAERKLLTHEWEWAAREATVLEDPVRRLAWEVESFGSAARNKANVIGALLARDAENREAGMVLVRQEVLGHLLWSPPQTSDFQAAFREADAILAATDTEGEGNG